MKLSKLLDEIKVTAPERPPFMEGDIRDLGANYGINEYYLKYIISVKETPKKYKVVTKRIYFGPDGELPEFSREKTEYYTKGTDEETYGYKAINEHVKQKFLREKKYLYSKYLDKFKEEKINAPLLKSIISDITIPKEDYDSILKQAIEQIKKIQKDNLQEKAKAYANKGVEDFENAIKKVAQKIPADFSIFDDVLSEIKVVSPYSTLVITDSRYEESPFFFTFNPERENLKFIGNYVPDAENGYIQIDFEDIWLADDEEENDLYKIIKELENFFKKNRIKYKKTIDIKGVHFIVNNIKNYFTVEDKTLMNGLNEIEKALKEIKVQAPLPILEIDYFTGHETYGEMVIFHYEVESQDEYFQSSPRQIEFSNYNLDLDQLSFVTDSPALKGFLDSLSPSAYGITSSDLEEGMPQWREYRISNVSRNNNIKFNIIDQYGF
jgi:hypothetical protein